MHVFFSLERAWINGISILDTETWQECVPSVDAYSGQVLEFNIEVTLRNRASTGFARGGACFFSLERAWINGISILDAQTS